MKAVRCPLFVGIASIAVGVGGASAAHADEAAPRLAVKRLFAPAEDVVDGIVVLPDPEATPTRSRVCVLTSAFASATATARVGFHHGGGWLRIVPLGSDACRWRIRLLTEGLAIPLVGTEGSVGRVGEHFASQALLGLEDATRSYELDAPAGDYIVECAADVPNGTPAVVVVDDGTGVALSGHVASRVQRVDHELALVVGGVGAPGDALALPAPVGGAMRPVVVSSATVEWSDGVVEPPQRVQKRDDGSVRLTFARARRGDALIRVDGSVLDERGAWRPRSLAYATRVADGAELAGAAVLELDGRALGDAWLSCAIGVRGARAGEVVFAAAELWAGERLLGWIGGLAEVEDRDGAKVVRLGVERARLLLERGERLCLRNVRLHERDGFAVLDHRADLVPSVTVALERGAWIPQAGSWDWWGVPGIATVPAPAVTGFVPPIGSHALALVHGYCADANPWPAAQFGSDAWRYEQPNQNLSNDAFAVDIAARAAQFKSYGLIGHSQGGCAALHLYAYYWSGLDWAGPGRLLQCVGAPLEGTALAGNLAALGQIFGVQCGSNYDMTYDGAAAWLSGIPTAARAKLYTHTTTFTDVPFFYDYCSIVSDLFLSDPEDGVTEDFSGHIVGGQNMGLRAGWCHVSGMRDPAQTGDANRNATMNAQGAR